MKTTLKEFRKILGKELKKIIESQNGTNSSEMPFDKIAFDNNELSFINQVVQRQEPYYIKLFKNLKPVLSDNDYFNVLTDLSVILSSFESNPMAKRINQKIKKYSVGLTDHMKQKNKTESQDRVNRHEDGYGDALEENDEEECEDGENLPPLRAVLHQDPQQDPIPTPPVDDTEPLPIHGHFMDEVTPPGFEKIVRGMKKNKEVDNPWAVAWSMKKKGVKP